MARKQTLGVPLTIGLLIVSTALSVLAAQLPGRGHGTNWLDVVAPYLFVSWPAALLTWHFTKPKRTDTVWIVYQTCVLMVCILGFTIWCAFRQKVMSPQDLADFKEEMKEKGITKSLKSPEQHAVREYRLPQH